MTNEAWMVQQAFQSRLKLQHCHFANVILTWGSVLTLCPNLKYWVKTLYTALALALLEFYTDALILTFSPLIWRQKTFLYWVFFSIVNVSQIPSSVSVSVAQRPAVSCRYEKVISVIFSSNTTTKYHAVFLNNTIQLFQLRREDSFKNLRSKQLE